MRTRGDDSHPQAQEKKPTLLTPWSWTSSLQDCETMRFPCLSPSLWYLVTAALANECTFY